MADPKTFYTETLPAQFQHALRDQQRLVEEAQRTLDGMRGVDATLQVEVRGEGGGRFVLNVGGGELTPGDAPTHPPFLTLIQEREDFDRLVAEAGDSALGFLGGISGLAGEMKLTRAKLEALASVTGCLRFVLQGERGFSLLTHFGPEPVPEEPTTTISVDADVYEALQSGELSAPDAFLTGKITVEGDMNLAMQVALAAMTPD